MKKYIYSLALVIAAPFFVQVASAEADVKSTDIFKQEIELTIGALETQRKLVLVEALALTAGDSEFWNNSGDTILNYLTADVFDCTLG